MFRSRFLWKLFAGYAVLTLASTMMVGAFFYYWLKGDSYDEIEASLMAKAVLMKEICGTNPAFWRRPELREKLQRLGSETGVRITVIDRWGIVAADSEQDPATMENHGTLPEIHTAGVTGVGVSTRFNSKTKKEMMYLAVPVRDQTDTLVGFVRVAIPLTIVKQRLWNLSGMIALWVVIGLLLALLIGLVFSKRVISRLININSVVKSIISGDLTSKVRATGNDEVGDLGNSINEMARELADRLDALLLERAKLLAVFSGMVEGVIAIDSDDTVIHMNSIAGKLLGVDPSVSIGRRIWEAVRVKEVIDIIITARDEAREIRGKINRLIGSINTSIEMVASPMGGSDHKVTGAVLMLHDVTELRKLESVRRDFVANAAHELQTPLTAIRGMVETILDDESMSPEQQSRFLSKIRAQTVRLSNIVEDLLTISKLESRERSIQLSEVDIRSAVSTAVGNFVERAKAKHITLQFEAPSETMMVKGNEEALQQIIGNLLDNAIKYTPAGGKVWVRTRIEGGTAVIEVEDNGIGIEPKDQERIFERFYRVDQGRSRELGGTGLGLSIVKHLVNALNGEVSVESAPGKGSIFRVILHSNTIN